MKKVLLIVNNNPIDPLGIMYLISNANADIDVSFVSEDYIGFYNGKKYDVVGFSTITGSHLFHNKIAKLVKINNPNVVTIMGGPHPTFFHKECTSLSQIDYICVGEGVISFNKWLNGEPTKNIIKNDGSFNGQLDLLCDINKVNLPDREKIYSKNNRGSNPIKNFMGIFGCPFNCSYCMNESYSKLYKGQSRIRYKNPKDYVNEIKDCCIKYPTKLIYFQEDTFIINRTWFKEVTDSLLSDVNIPYHCHIRCDLMTEEIAEHLWKTNCKSVTFAIENGNELYRKMYLNRKMTDKQILNTSDLLHKYNIKFRIENMVGLPTQCLVDDIETLELNAKCKPTIGWASLFQPFPNTKLSEYAKDCDEWDGDIDSINPGFFDESSLDLCDKIKRERLQKLFSLACEYKFIRKILPFLLKLPLDNLYKNTYQKFKDKKYKELYGN